MRIEVVGLTYIYDQGMSFEPDVVEMSPEAKAEAGVENAKSDMGKLQRYLEIVQMDVIDDNTGGTTADFPEPSGGANKSDVEGQGETSYDREIPQIIGDPDHGSDEDYISNTDADDTGSGGTDGRLSEAGQKRMEQVKKSLRKFVTPRMRAGAELVTDPPEHEPDEDVKPGAGQQKE